MYANPKAQTEATKKIRTCFCCGLKHPFDPQRFRVENEFHVYTSRHGTQISKNTSRVPKGISVYSDPDIRVINHSAGDYYYLVVIRGDMEVVESHQISRAYSFFLEDECGMPITNTLCLPFKRVGDEYYTDWPKPREGGLYD